MRRWMSGAALLLASLAAQAGPIAQPGMWQLDVVNGAMETGSRRFCQREAVTVEAMAAKVAGIARQTLDKACQLTGKVAAPGISRYRCQLDDKLRMDVTLFWQQLKPTRWSAGMAVKLTPASQETALQQLTARRVGACK